MRTFLIVILACLTSLKGAPIAAGEPLFDVKNVLNVLTTNSHNENSLITHFRTIFDDVFVLQHIGSDALPAEMVDDEYFGVILDLWMNDQPYATAVCHSYGSGSIGQLRDAFSDEATQFSQAVQRDIAGENTRRIVCTFDYWDPETEVKIFIRQATEWLNDRIGPSEKELGTTALERLTSVNYELQPEGGPWAMSIALLADGEEAHVILAMIVEVHPFGY